MAKSSMRARSRRRRHARVRKLVEGTPERPRLCVFRSHRHIYAQVIDDWNHRTLVSVSSMSRELRDSQTAGGSVSGATTVGELVGRKCIEKGIRAVVFDRGGYRYHGRVKALADAARAQFATAGAPGF